MGGVGGGGGGGTQKFQEGGVPLGGGGGGGTSVKPVNPPYGLKMIALRIQGRSISPTGILGRPTEEIRITYREEMARGTTSNFEWKVECLNDRIEILKRYLGRLE